MVATYNFGSVYIHTEHLALDEVKHSLCCYFHRGYRITNLILK